MVEISRLKPGLPRSEGIKPHDILISINGFDIGDVLDYRFRITEKRLY